MKNAKKNYCYLIRRKRDGKLFCTYGNFKAESVPDLYKKITFQIRTKKLLDTNKILR